MKKILLVLLLVLAYCMPMFSSDLIGAEGDNILFRCYDNADLAMTIGEDPEKFDLNHFDIVCKKVPKREVKERYYYLIISTDLKIYVIYKTEEYDIYFYTQGVPKGVNSAE